MLPLFFLPILGINQVSAQEITNTPTYQPLFPTGTPRPTINSVCPDGQPIGWQTVTPSFKWLNYCSQCIGRPTADWSDFEATPFPEPYISHLGNCTLEELDDGCQIVTHGAGLACQCVGQLTPTPTLSGYEPYPNGTPTQQTNNNFFKVPLGNFNLSANTYNYLPVSNSFGGNKMCGDGNIFVGLYVNMDYTVTHLNDGYEQIILFANSTNAPFSVSTWQNKWNRYGTGSFNWERCYTSDYGNNDTVASLPGSSGNLHPCDELYGVDVPHINLLVNLYGGNPNYSNYFVWGGYRNYLYVNGYAEAMCYGIGPTATPYPTPTINDTGSDYCNEVEPKPSYEADQVGFQLPIPSYGVGQCVVFGFEIGLGWLENLFPNLFQFPVPESLGIPNFQICVRPITFGDLNIFGILIDLDYLLLAAAVIMVVRWLFRS